MSLAEISVITGGVLSLFMALFHARFPKLFDWQSDFQLISTKNAKIHYTIHLALILVFSGIGILSLLFASDLAACTGLSLGLMLYFSLFWLWRTVWQTVYFSPIVKDGKPFILHVLLIIFFGLLMSAYTIPIVLRFM